MTQPRDHSYEEMRAAAFFVLALELNGRGDRDHPAVNYNGLKMGVGRRFEALDGSERMPVGVGVAPR